MQISKRILAILVSAAMLFSISACESKDPVDGPASTTTSGGAGDASSSDDNASGDDKTPDNNELPAFEDYDFGAISFSAKDFKIIAGMDSKVGGNKNGEDGKEFTENDHALNIVGFRGYPKPADGFPGEDTEGDWSTLVSQNGPFWENIQKVEASFFLSGSGDPKDISNIEIYMQAGSIGKFDYYNPGAGNNLMDTVIIEDEHDFSWGDVMTAKWDIDWFKENKGETLGWDYEKNEGYDFYYFDNPPVEEEDTGDMIGGGLNKFGIIVEAKEAAADVTVKIHWTDVKFYVHDKAKWDADIANVEEVTGMKMSDNAKANVIEVS